jgi:uncharacterized membrane protein
MGKMKIFMTTFNDQQRAKAVLEDLEDMTKEGAIDYVDAAVLRRDDDGYIHVNETLDPTTMGKGAVVGGIIGGFIGLIAGPIGAGFGAASGAALGGYTSDKVDLGIPDEELEDMALPLRVGTSALVVVIDDAWTDGLLDFLNLYEGRVVEKTLSDEAVKKLEGK